MNISLKPVSIFLKKYSTLIPSLAILLAALLLFAPIYLIGGSVKKSMAVSGGLARQVQSEQSDVPCKDKAEQVKLYMDSLEKDATQIETLALQSCQRELITYEDVIFPKPVDSSAQVFAEFGQKFRLAIEDLLKSMRAMDAPSDAEISSVIGSNVSMREGMFSSGRTPLAEDPRIDGRCLARAQEISVYAHPKAFTWYEFWEKYKFAGEKQALEDCWDSQVSFWIYQDVVDTILKMNGDSAMVNDSAVKRLLGVSFSGPVIVQGGESRFYGEFMMDRMPSAGRDIPNYVTPRLMSNFLDYSPTGRVSNEEVDIVHFAVSVVVDNRFALGFVKELCSEKTHSFRTDFAAGGEQVNNARHNQISILQTDIKAVDPAAPQHRFYRYGNGAVVQLDLVCEYQFYRKSYDAIKPQPIQERLNLTAEATGLATPPVSSPADMGMGL